MAVFLSQYILELWWEIGTGKARFQAAHKMYVDENLQVIHRWNDFPFTCDRKDLKPVKRQLNGWWGAEIPVF